jgi:hypothetical protein
MSHYWDWVIEVVACKMLVPMFTMLMVWFASLPDYFNYFIMHPAVSPTWSPRRPACHICAWPVCPKDYTGFYFCRVYSSSSCHSRNPRGLLIRIFQWICVGVRSRILAWARAGILGVPRLLIVVRRGRRWKDYPCLLCIYSVSWSLCQNYFLQLSNLWSSCLPWNATAILSLDRCSEFQAVFVSCTRERALTVGACCFMQCTWLIDSVKPAITVTVGYLCSLGNQSTEIIIYWNCWSGAALSSGQRYICLILKCASSLAAIGSALDRVFSC